MKKISILALLLVVFLPAFCLNLLGTVKDEKTLSPIKGALVTLTKDGALTAKVKTEADGSFKFEVQENADYKIQITKDGYGEERIALSTVFRGAVKELPSLDLLLTPLDPANTVNKPVEELVVKSSVSSGIEINVSGKVFSRFDGVLSGVKVLMKNRLNGDIQSAVTDKEGNYAFKLVPNANYYVEVENNITAYSYFGYVLSTIGVGRDINIFRNIERIGTLASTGEKTEATKEVKPKEEKNNTVAGKDNAPVEEKKAQKDKEAEMMKELNKKYEQMKKDNADKEKKLETAKKEKEEKKMVARNVVVKITDMDEKKSTVNEDSIAKYKEGLTAAAKAMEEKQLAEQKRIESEKKAADLRSKELEAKKRSEAEKQLAEQKRLEEQKRKEDLMAAANAKAIEEKQLAEQKRIESEKKAADLKTKELEAKRKTETEKQLAEQKRLEEASRKSELSDETSKKAENNRIDSMIGTAPKFMHQPGAEKKANKQDVQTNSALPIGNDETRTPVIDNKIYYPAGKAMLDDMAKEYLAGLASKMLADSSIHVSIIVHTDANMETTIEDYLCKLRSRKVLDELLNRGVSFQRLTVRLTGMKQPSNSCVRNKDGCTDLDHQMNRFTELVID